MFSDNVLKIVLLDNSGLYRYSLLYFTSISQYFQKNELNVGILNFSPVQRM